MRKRWLLALGMALCSLALGGAVLLFWLGREHIKQPEPVGFNGSFSASDRTSVEEGVEQPARDSKGEAEKTMTQEESSFAVTNVMATLREKVLQGPYGKVPIEQVLQALRDIPGGPELQEVFRALAVRKAEALPLVKERLHSGEWWEKHMLTKLLRYSPWPETYTDVLELALSPEDSVLARTGALYALGAMGNPAAGSALVEILRDDDVPADVKLVAIATIFRIGYRAGIDDIRPYATSEDIQIRIFANRALAELGHTSDKEFLLASLNGDDYVMRDEAAAALAFVSGDDVVLRLHEVASNDQSQAVRNSATLALLRREIVGLNENEKLDVLRSALPRADQHLAISVVMTILQECGSAGEDYLRELSAQNTVLGERAGTFLMWHNVSMSQTAAGESP